ncbi:hypothetical protein BGX27_005573, partial [Mortierella sp. AM989]
SSLITRDFKQNEIKSELAQTLCALEKHMEHATGNKEILQELTSMRREIKDLLLKAEDKNNEMLALQQEAKEKDDKMLRLQLEAKEKDDEMLRLQQEAKERDELILDRLAILQKHAHAILVQNFELHEYPIPRLFIILPVNPTKWNPKNVLENKFRLHFLCECGDHTLKSSNSSQNQIHIARHEGYEIRDGTEFFKSYGKYMLILMRGLKLGIQAVDISAPLKPIQGLLDARIDLSINYMEALATDKSFMTDITIDNYKALEGSDLRQLGTFLQVNDENRKLGDLYRITIDTGHVKWVCIDHYDATYQKEQQKAFEDAVEVNGGNYDSQLGN